MDNSLKKRLIGAAVLASLGVIFIPMLLEEDTVIDSDIYSSNIPEKQITSFEKPLVTDQEISEFKEQVEFGSSIMPQEGAEVKEINNQADLEEKKEQAAPVKTRVGLTSWMVQAGSFSNHDNAEKVVSQLRNAGYDTHLETAQVKNKKVYRVRVGPEIDRSNADNIAKEISKKFFLSTRVIRYP